MRGKTPEDNNKSKQSGLPMMEKKRRGVGKKYKSGRKKKLGIIRKMAFDQRVRDDTYGSLIPPAMLDNNEDDDAASDIAPPRNPFDQDTAL